VFAEMATPGTVFEGEWRQNAFLSQPEIGKALRRRAHINVGAMFDLVNAYTEQLLRIQKQYAEWTGLALLKSTVEELEARLATVREAQRGCVLPLGWGAGFLSKVAILNAQDETYRGILRQVGLYTRAIQAGLPFPKTRRIVFLGNQPASLPGFVHLEVAGKSSRHPAQESRSRWFATPFLWTSFPDYTPVYPGDCAYHVRGSLDSQRPQAAGVRRDHEPRPGEPPP